MSDQTLQGKVALVTGAARGIGYGIATRLAKEGASIVLADINSELNQRSAEVIARETGARTAAVRCDVTDRSQVDAAIAACLDNFGGIDIAVSNAGICPFVEILDMDEAMWKRTIDVILTGSFHVAQAAARKMIEQGRGGRIIFITSGSTIMAASNQADYAAAKSGERMFMATLARAVGKHNITSNAVSPGVVYTEMGAHHWDIAEHREQFARTNPIGRLAQPADIAAAVAYLSRDESEYITGSTLRVDGGLMPIG
jgi:NAD(P)-dependent dehydrogenase (short-subunit alcohol dehydrogenase family)